MTGSGPAGEVVHGDVLARLAVVVARVVDAEAGHEHTAAEVAAAGEDDQAEQ